jgi:hypothetical protein
LTPLYLPRRMPQSAFRQSNPVEPDEIDGTRALAAPRLTIECGKRRRPLSRD